MQCCAGRRREHRKASRTKCADCGGELSQRQATSAGLGAARRGSKQRAGMGGGHTGSASQQVAGAGARTELPIKWQRGSHLWAAGAGTSKVKGSKSGRGSTSWGVECKATGGRRRCRVRRRRPAAAPALPLMSAPRGWVNLRVNLMRWPSQVLQVRQVQLGPRLPLATPARHCPQAQLRSGGRREGEGGGVQSGVTAVLDAPLSLTNLCQTWARTDRRRAGQQVAHTHWPLLLSPAAARQG